MMFRFFLWAVTMLGCLVSVAQQRTVVFCEGFGEGASNVSISEFSGWDRPDGCYEGTGKIGNSELHVCTLPESSGKGYVYFSSENIRELRVRHLDIKGYHDLEFSFLLKKDRVNSGKLLVEVYVDNQQVDSYNPDLKDTDSWFTVPVHSIPEGSVLDLILRNEDTKVTLYMDDLEITGVADAPVGPEKPTVTPEPGLYTEPVSLIWTAPEDASVYYTLDGSEPTKSSELYLEPVLLDHTATVSAVAVSAGGRSEVVTAHYEIRQVPVVNGAQAFCQAEGDVRLDLHQAQVVDVDDEGIYVQLSDGGLLFPAGSVAASKGDCLEGFLVGAPRQQYGVTGITGGIFSRLAVCSVSSPLTPLSVSLSDVLHQPERYAACLLQLEDVAYRTECGGLCSSDGTSEQTLRVVTGAWAENETWTWPEKMTVQGVLKGDEAGMYLWVASADQIITDDSQPVSEPLGTALVLTNPDGTCSAARTQISQGGLLCTPVTVLQGRAVVPAEDASDLLWEVHEDKGYLMTPDGKYLQGVSSGTGLNWTDAPDAFCEWCKVPEEGYWKWQKENRALFRSYSKGVIKNYALSNLQTGSYSWKPVVDLPLFAGYLRTLTPGRWGTLCVPYAVRKGDFSGALCFEIKGRLNGTDGTTTAVVLSGPADHLEAGVPYVIYAETSTLVLLYAGDPVSFPVSRNGLQGTFDGVNTGKDPADASLTGKYVFSGNILRRCMAGSSVGENKAYVDLDQVPVLQEMPAGALRIQVNRETTGMNCSVAPVLRSSAVYTLNGVNLGSWQECKEHLQKGIYIIDGMKISVK